MAQGASGRFFAGRELVDRVARHSPARLAVTVFAAVISLFTLLLLAPWATTSGKSASLIDALFTATSAVCVTGLVVVPTGTYWSFYGQVVILVGIKVGGLGVMTLASILGMAVSRRIGLTQKLLTASETKTTRLGEVGSLVRVVIITSTSIELLIALLLLPRFIVLEESFGEAAWHGLFYGISAFNNAGFVPTPEGLAPYVGDWMLCLPIILGVFIGSLGFPVILNVMRNRGRVVKWSLHTKLTLTMSVGLVVVGTVLFAAFEWRNAETLGPLSLGEKALASLFAGVMPRSGGFSTVDIGAMHESSWLITDALMFVGGGSASTAGGIKVTTLAVMLLAIVSEARGDRDMEAFGRRVPRETLRLAVAVSFVGATAVLVSSLLLLEITGWTLDVILFETISAFATVGLSTGVTADLPTAGKYVLVVLMFIGRTGTMTLAAALALRDRRRVIRYPEERPIIG
ncbi:TrkH family potassium uptake protein [Oerskovia turbata]|uniref:TrkH family potassium uptake protein n=1 Tax=Oerskovia turbata TaxID=1713 RepID=A0A4Q1KTZ6_9CELL|nr:potassium transporter TrkG [Oerskovia turbata]RXR23609.1 TrkH family potassium uptake protein [Oerskovia turbata]RXR32879.1 TrkH family potassium uptake protein [Oerskovia turbata]TGJ95178.1 potassium transporter Trk [Actinotalea fermentans ATCC 43279 = JCM 9966 = DSM 3133]